MVQRTHDEKNLFTISKVHVSSENPTESRNLYGKSMNAHRGSLLAVTIARGIVNTVTSMRAF